MKIPILVVGDAPSVIGGLSRIARDLTLRLWQEQEELGIEVAQAGIRYNGEPFPWRVYPLFDEENWGKGDWERVWGWHSQGRLGVVLSVWDPSRCWELVNLFTQLHKDGPKLQNPPDLWGYFAVDSETEKGGFGGPAAEAVQRYNRVLAYGAWGSTVLRKVIQKGKKLQWLPHGVDLQQWKNNGWEGKEEKVRLLGCVATNQSRKDLGLFFSAAAMLRKHSGWENLHLWLHTDFLVKSWSVVELAELYGWNSELLIVTQQLGQQEMANMLGAADVTLACGRGEGFGYPIVESLAAGTPVVHTSFGGGAEWVPRAEWLVEPKAMQIEGTYALQRPLHDAEEVAEKLAAAGDWKRDETVVCQEYCKGAVKNLDWTALWPRWKSWMKAGLKSFRERE